ncbi:type II toxin-antitoxin system RelE/ParE family toxin [Vibrio sp. SCSIO 43136]|uniref:type II toxin-antitoxin system RelE/ParE family toxin n=1 Tax=Vibrio sp. SCSIO 43136 TaxID=2819101 RepID=UPI00207592A9|nr:type II toxin-antitoxin system RelE/ParE family toxin [Vibrio sp. SCSIO 43136]USD65613.1 type II toxin-antitoxin system RelE/ParE family toxin [Vibrio sp. SCSIO 43136]
MWNIETRARFDDWYWSLTDPDRISIQASLLVLAEKGAQLGRPHADSLHGSKHSNMKELRVQSQGRPIRIFFAFDPERTGIVLCGGDKSGDKRFYRTMIPIADAEYDKHLEELKNG